MYVLGVHVGHDSGAAIVHDGEILAASNEERFVGIKHFANIPFNAISFCLKKAEIRMSDVDVLAVPTVSDISSLFAFFNLRDDQLTLIRPQGEIEYGVSDYRSTLLREAQRLVRRNLPPDYFPRFPLSSKAKVMQIDHHLAHAASAFYTSGFGKRCLVFTVDGIGNDVSTAVWICEDDILKPLMRVGSKGSLGWFYGLVTEALGWWIGDGEGKTMALAPYGNSNTAKVSLESIVPKYEGCKLMKPHDFGFISYWTLHDTYHWHLNESSSLKEKIQLYGAQDLAAASQVLLEEQMLEIVESWCTETGLHSICCAGGVFLNVKMNQRIREIDSIKEMHIFPNAGDGGLAVGAALYASHLEGEKLSTMQIDNVFWGPEFSNDYIKSVLDLRQLDYEFCDDISGACGELLAHGDKAIGWVQGREENGPRALGNRSIFISPLNEKNKEIVNKKIKHRENWRPFAPSILWEHAPKYVDKVVEAPFMIISFNAKIEKRDEIPAVVHIDGTTRPQTVRRETNEKLWELLRSFEKETATPLILNTSFNLSGKPIIGTIEDAIMTFYNSGLDYLALGNYLLKKKA
jgi:carbamoyltransferase